MTILRLGSLFSGIGGLELGLESAFQGTLRTVWQVEQSVFCRTVLAKHWPHATRYNNVRTVGASTLAPVDIICGGFPCQDISVSGCGAGLAGTRSGLWSEYARIIRELRPRLVVVENVPALAQRGLDTVLGDLAAIRYDTWWDCVRASDVRAPHRRERIFVVAYTDNPGCPQQRGTRATQTENATPERARGGGALNPEWVELLMGFPPGWTDPGLPEPVHPRTRGNPRASHRKRPTG